MLLSDKSPNYKVFLYFIYNVMYPKSTNEAPCTLLETRVLPCKLLEASSTCMFKFNLHVYYENFC